MNANPNPNQNTSDSIRLALDHERAKARAARLRDEAIDDFWRGADAVLRRSLQSSQDVLARSTRRLHSRLMRRQAGRPGTLLEG